MSIFGKKENPQKDEIRTAEKPQAQQQGGDQNLIALDNKITEITSLLGNVAHAQRGLSQRVDQLAQAVINQAKLVDRFKVVKKLEPINTSSKHLLTDEVEIEIPHQIMKAKVTDLEAIKQTLNGKGCIVSNARFPTSRDSKQEVEEEETYDEELQDEPSDFIMSDLSQGSSEPELRAPTPPESSATTAPSHPLISSGTAQGTQHGVSEIGEKD